MATREQLLQALRAADAAGDAQAAQAIARALQAAPAAPAPPATPPGLPAAPGGPPGPQAPAVVATPPPTPVPGPPVAPQIGGSVDPTEGMSGPQRFLAGMGQSVDSTLRGGRQLFNYLTGDQEELAQLNAAENEARMRDQPLLATGAGRGGQVAGHVAQALLPASAAGKVAQAAGGGLRATMLTEGAAGALQGAVQPTAGDESRLTNAVISGAFGGAVPAVTKLAALPVQLKANLASAIAPRGTGAVAQTLSRIGSKSDKIRRRAGEEIGRLTADIRVPMTKQMAAKLRTIRNDYGDELPKAARSKLDEWIAMGEQGGVKLKGRAAQQAFSDLGAEASESAGFKAAGLNRAKRVMDEAIQSQMTKAQARSLARARETYRTGVKPTNPVSYGRAGARGLAQALRAGSLPIYNDEDTQQ